MPETQVTDREKESQATERVEGDAKNEPSKRRGKVGDREEKKRKRILSSSFD